MKRGKCPIHRMTIHSLADCGFLKHHGYRCTPTSSTPDVSAGAGRHVSFPPATTLPVQSPAPAAPQPAPASSVPAPPPAIGHATYASALSSFPPALSDDDDISVGYDFVGSDGSPNTTTSDAPTSYDAPCFVDEEQCPTPFVVPPPTPPSHGFLPSWILRPSLFLIYAYSSTCHQSLNSNTSLLPTCRTVRQVVQSYVFSHTLRVRRYGLHGTHPSQIFPRAHSMRAPTPGYTCVYRQRGFL
jgi:hypothetical protein